MTPPTPSSSAPTVAATAEQVLDTFRRDGIAVTSFADLLGEELWEIAAADIAPFVAATGEEAAKLAERKRAKKKEEVIVRRFYAKDGGEPVFSVSDIWLRIALSEPVLAIVNGYTSEPRLLTYVDNWFTVPYPEATKRVASQRWHRDPYDERIVKMFIYFSDVDEGAGPFEYIRESPAGGKYGELFPWEYAGVYPPSDELENAVDPADHLTMTGPAGTVIFCDTAGFHRGGFARTKPRILMVSNFLRETAGEGKRRFAVDLDGRESSLSSAAREALAGS